ncbi:MAG TPA: DUF2269 family protein [Trueperaceae bacterium]
MQSIYTLFKFLHIIGAIVWIGGALSLAVVNTRASRAKDPSALAALAQQSGFYGRALLGPAALLTLIAGIVMVAVSGAGAPLWVVWGLVGVFASMALGGALIGRTTGRLLDLAQAAGSGDERVSGLRRRLAVLNVLNVLLLFSVVWAMVFKPTL